MRGDIVVDGRWLLCGVGDLFPTLVCVLYR